MTQKAELAEDEARFVVRWEHPSLPAAEPAQSALETTLPRQRFHRPNRRSSRGTAGRRVRHCPTTTQTMRTARYIQ